MAPNRPLTGGALPEAPAPMRITRLPSPAAFAEATWLAAPATGPELLFLLFFGSEDAETGLSWCPDCVLADPVIRHALSLITRVAVHLVECPVGRRSDYKATPDHPYRRDPRVRLERIPTLIRWAGGAEVGRLVESECFSADAILRLAALQTKT